MTIFELLEKLETEIVALRSRFENLEASLAHATPNGNAPSRNLAPKKPLAIKKKNTPKKKQAARPKAKAVPSGTDSQQLELTVTEQAPVNPEQTERVLGKRQALGRSLVQLRKMSAWRAHKASEE